MALKINDNVFFGEDKKLAVYLGMNEDGLNLFKKLDGNVSSFSEIPSSVKIAKFNLTSEDIDNLNSWKSINDRGYGAPLNPTIVNNYNEEFKEEIASGKKAKAEVYTKSAAGNFSAHYNEALDQFISSYRKLPENERKGVKFGAISNAFEWQQADKEFGNGIALKKMPIDIANEIGVDKKYSSLISPEMEAYEEHFKETSGQPTKQETEDAKRTGETKEGTTHDQKMEEPQKKRNESAAETAQEGTKTGTARSASGSPKSVDGQIAKRNIIKGKFGLLGGLALGAGAVWDFKNQKDQGATNLEAGFSAAASTAVAGIIGPVPFLGYMAGKEMLDGVKNVGSTLIDRTKEANRVGTASPFQFSNFIETRDTFTMRQAAMAAIGQARGNVENAMAGSEASLLHR